MRYIEQALYPSDETRSQVGVAVDPSCNIFVRRAAAQYRPEFFRNRRPIAHERGQALLCNLVAHDKGQCAHGSRLTRIGQKAALPKTVTWRETAKLGFVLPIVARDCGHAASDDHQ